MKQALVGARIFTGEEFLENQALIINGDAIEAVVPASDLSPDFVRVELSGGVLAPGFIDLQVNGGGGAFFTNNTSVDAIQTMLDGHRPTGTTSFLPTLISDTREVHQAGVRAVADAVAAGVKGVLGVHVEGPFFDMARRGAHNERYIRKMEQADIDWLAASVKAQHEFKVMLTLAPEHADAGQIKQLTSAGVVVCAGHTDGHYDDVVAALKEGLSGFTHLYNAMRPTTGREPGVVGAALEDTNSWCGIIIDTYHVHAASARIAYAAKPKGKMYLVTDAMSTVGSPEKSFQIYGETIYEKDGCLVNAEGRLAGSAIGMIDAVRLNTHWVGVELAESLRMASLYPAEFMQVDNYLGRIRANYRADLVHFTDDFKVTRTWIAGDMHTHN
ncbi:N-acetylglucosamine-6-phosphate deacetylase [Cellvibrio sp. KY-GH-1]|uniref:N-acetylglucosamine-6-phosphate deacetylase n=1 Tax=Cellvibrio sp. KY-GH-1 TaxID=2303332 RepID=UPI001245977B|nr:N-acetylglucosamine-6-phosphate deacetylase [Cellvibrio sp. KY-GH-1]QEY16429.1 N-acetylglucosamine-6-phosphate deacetylase [Cellvibrio sp. KY-GH-1]